ncbi:MAG: hypothetical protein AAB529_01535 [Patescibacteria group bacterium]|mgnify:FL=1
MIQLIATIIFLGSMLGIIFILYRKIPVLVELPKNGSHGLSKGKFIIRIENKVKDIYALFSKQIILHKFLSWVKVMTLKTETKIDTLLHSIRKKAQKIDEELKDKK